MSAEICGLKLFDDKQVKFVVIKLNASLKKGDLNGFLSFIKRFKHPGNQIRLSPSKADDDIEIADSLRLFDRTIDSVLAAYTGDMSVSEIKKKISDVMNFEMDNTQEDIPSLDNETKTKFEAQDKNRANLTEHYKEFYGLDSYTIIQALQRTFSDRLSTATYYDQFTGEMTDFDNHTLNLRIMDEKARMFKSLVEYLKQQYGEEAADFKSEMYDEDGKLDLINYYNALNFFYDKVKKIDNFSEQLQTQQNNVLLEQEKKEKTDKYTALWNKLYLSDEFKKRADKKFTGFKARQAPTKLYEGENYSQYYAFLKKYIEKYGSDDDKKAISEIEKKSPSLLSASLAYTMLTHFDQLIKETFGDDIDIQEGLENAEFDSDTKYSYHRDVKHEVKGWQTSEDVGAEKHTSQFTKTVLDMIGVFNYKTGEYTHRRVNSTSLIVASRNLMDALITHNITFKDIKIDSEYTPTPGEGRKNKNDYANELYSLARNFHANPVGNLQRILELLFSKQPGMSKALVDAVDIQNQQITGYDLNILKSVYNVVFDRENTNSFFAKASNKAGRENAAANVLLEEIAGYVDRNAVADYLESKFDYSTGLMKLSAKKKFFNVKDQFNTKTRVNQFVNSMTTDKLQSLADKYQLTEGQLGDSSAKIGKNTEYSIKIGDYTISLIVSNNIKAGIFGTVRPGLEGTMYFKVTKNEITPEGETTKDVTSEFFQKISNPNIGIATNFRYSKMHSLPLESEGARLLNGVLQFIDDTTGLGLLSNPSKNLQVLGTLQQLYSPIEGFHYFIQPLLRMAMKSAYAEKLRLDANKAGKPLAKYLSDTSNAAYMAYLRSKKSNRSFTEVFNDLRPVVATTFDQTINQWVDAESVLSGQASKATTKDSAGNSIPNNTVAKLGTNLVYYLQKEAAEDSKVRFLLFAQNPDMIVKTFHDLEVTNTEGETKAISDFTNGELFFHAIFNKFWDSYLATGHVIVQPTTYSDKTTFLNWELNPVYKGKNLMTMSKSELLNEYFETLGITTKRILAASTDKLNQIVQAYATGVKAKALEILNSTEKQEDKQVALDNFLNQGENRFFYTSTPQTDLNTMLHHITESQLVTQAQKMNLSVTLNHDYVKLKSGFCQLDSSLLFNQKLYNSTTEGGMLDRLLEKQKAIFVQQLLLNYCSYQVLTDGDTVSQYEADTIDSNVKSKNPIIKTILGYCDKQENKIKARTEFFKNWVDESTGKLIIAKQNGRNIMSLSDGFNPNEKVELNPLLDKFFYVEGFLSNQLRYTLTGFETNHPIKTQTQFDRLHKAYNGVVTHKFTSYDLVKLWLDSQSQLDKNLRDKDYSDIKFITDSSIFNQAHLAFRFNDLNDLGNYLYSEQGKTDSAHSFLQDLWETSNIQILNNRQSTQFKRNVIIPATLQYCVQNSRDGIPPRIKCAVVKDDQAPVYNYRGDHEGDIDACDGSAQITPFQCILENRALGSQAVGFIKKPIWHSYDRESGTAFLAKFATDTMTNEAMRSSSASSVRLYNMFRKATNLLWNPADNIDLTRPITMEASISGAEGEALQNWFAKNITCNQPLCYKDKYGNIMEIKLLDRTVTLDGAKYYYTVEKDSYGNTVNKYHIFYDSADENGNVTKSKHYTFDTYQKAAKFVSEHQGAHTINSLFELHSALGGINSCNKEGIFGEYNNEVVCNYMCNIGSKKPGVKGTPYIDQTTYTQPLKQYQIGYILNDSAVKNGAKNVNLKERWKDDEDLTWFEVDSDGLGMQMNADHDIVDSELTEFSQVIAATSAYGFTYNNCNEIFKGLASTAFQASQLPLVAVNKFLNALAAETDYTVTDAQGNTRPMTDTEAMEADAKNKIKISLAKSDLYDAIGRIIFMNSSIKDNENLTNIIQQAVLHVFNKYSNHEKDEVKLPFSDANIYSDFIATLASTINKNSIKRKHPGTGAVMAPAYNMQQYFEISTDNGPRKLMASDVTRLAQEDYRRQLQDFLIQYGTHPVDESGNANTNIVKEATDEEGFGIGTARIAQLEKKAEQVANLRNKKNKSKKSDPTHALQAANENQEELDDIKAQAIKNGTFMKAPNGKPTNLNEQQWLQVRTKAFKKWFGDWEKIAKPYNRRTSKQTTVRLNKISGGKFNVNPETMKGVILTDANGHSIFNAMGRTFVLCNVNGNVIPFYQSSRGTSGKIKGAWYPFFGYTGNWLIKGDVDNEGKMSYSSGIDRITNLLNKDFVIPTDFDNKGISDSTGLNVRDLGLNMYTVFDRFGKMMSDVGTHNPSELVFYDNDLKELTNADALFVKEITGIKTKGIHQSHASGSFIQPFIDATNINNVSKVVDENGEPLVVYHHTDNPNLTEFSTDFDNYFAKDGGTKEAIFFDENKTGTLNRKYDISVFLNIKDLHEYNETKEQLHQRGTTYRQVVNESAAENNTDGGVHMKDFDDNKMEHQSIWIVHNPNQIKSATDNNGMFSTENESEDESTPAEIRLPKYYDATHNVDDAHEANMKMLQIYLKQLLAKEPARSLEYFMPSDIVAVFNADGTAVKDKNGNDLIININDLKTYYNFKKGIAPDGTIIMHDMVLKKCTTAPNNLRPSIIRWQYTGADGTDHWMNIFDTPAIKNSWGNRGPNYRDEVQATLNDVYNASEGNFDAISELNKNAEWLTGMKADTLENTDAELIMSNLYKDTFGVPDGKSLDQILDEGEDFFRRQTENLQAPKNNIYDYAFLRENGKHTLITIGNVTEDSQTVTEVPFTNITTEEHNAEGFADIYAVERGRKSFKIGRWINDNSIEYRDGKFLKDNQELDLSMYRVKDGIVQRRVNFVTRYNIKTKSTVRGVDFFKNNIMYKVATLDEIKEALQYTSKEAATVTEDTKTTDALRQQKHIIASIFNAGDYKYVEINREKRLQKGKVNAIRNSLIEVLGQGTLDPNLHSAIEDQLDLLSSDDAKKKQHLVNVKRDYLEKEAHKKWVSFQDSLKFIAARIPAQTLQSFMTMKLVGWTENSKNMAYVSHFQTYLLGSK